MKRGLVLVLVLLLLSNTGAFLRGSASSRAIRAAGRAAGRAAERAQVHLELSTEASALTGQNKGVAGKARALLADLDYLGQVNFCLTTTDGTLSGPSRSKLMNTVSNEVFKAIVIGDAKIIQDTLDGFAATREKISCLECFDIEEDGLSSATEELTRSIIVNIDGALDMAAAAEVDVAGAGTVGNIENAVGDAQVQSQKDAELDVDQNIQASMSYLRWLEQLMRDGSTNSDKLLQESKVSAYDRGSRTLLTMLRNAGCSFEGSSNGSEVGSRPWNVPKDSSICLSVLDNMLPATQRTLTRELNKISNIVSRTMLYGGAREKATVADSIEATIPSYIEEFFPLVCKEEQELCQEVVYLHSLCFLLRNGLSAAQEQIGGPLSSTGEFGESVIEGGIGQISIEAPPLRLYDTYTNAFQRVVDVCIDEIANRNSIAQNGDVLDNFVLWEQSLRRNLTADMWTPNPKELEGAWELLDVAGSGSLSPIMKTTSADFFQGMNRGVLVNLKPGGKVTVEYLGITGDQWFFKPGPAHLDTCEFTIKSTVDKALTLRYTGFIDRGQRIESRFSQQPIRMTGRVMSVINGEPQGSCRFIMAKRSGLRLK